jgi:hypothetical protein
MKLEPSGLQLRFVPLEALLLHEQDDPLRVKRLKLTLQREGKLRNPPIVAEQAGRYLVLDGATRTTALFELGYRDILVQVVDYYGEAVQVGAWNHVLVNVDGLILQPVDAETACRMLGTREIIAGLLMRNGQWFAVLGESDNVQRANLLCQFVAEYRGKAEVHRTVEMDLSMLGLEYPALTAVSTFPYFSPAEISQTALSGAKVPMGITRHMVAGRTLGLDIPLELLTDSQSLDAKNAWLKDLIAKRLQANKIRLYQEPVFVFDE